MKPEETPKKKPRCQFISKIGSRCQADPQTGKGYCFFHDPEQKKKQAEARKQGGEVRTRQMEPEANARPCLPAVRLESSGDVFELMALTVNHLRCGQIDVRVAQVLAYLASLVLRALKANQPMTVQLLSDIINEVRRGETNLRTAKTIGNLTAIMLTALKQEAQERQVDSITEKEAMRPAEPASPTQAMQHDRIEAVIRPITAAEPLDDYQPHAAFINGMAAANQAGHAEASHTRTA
jgi:hypothetical protein